MIYDPPSPDRLVAYLKARLAAQRVEVTNVKRSWPGMSRETWFVDTVVDGDAVRYVFRMDPPGGGFGLRPLDYESRLYTILDATDVPTQKLLWHEPTGNPWLEDGREFFVREWVEGTVVPAGVETDDCGTHREAVCKELVEKLALVHSLDWKALGVDRIASYVPSGVDDAAHVELDWHITHVMENRVEAHPALTEALLSLRDELPSPSDRIVLRKENNGIGEEIWSGTSIVAMADWENASLGAPELDLAVASKSTFRIWDVDKCISYYEKVSGTTVNPDALKFYSKMWTVRAIVGLQGGIPGFSSGRDQRLQLASLGLLARKMHSVAAASTGF